MSTISQPSTFGVVDRELDSRPQNNTEVLRNTFVHDFISSIKDAARSTPDLVEGKLHEAESAMQSLQKLDGGQNSKTFQSDLRLLNDGVNSPKDLGEQYLPLLEIAGLDRGGQILVRDLADDKLESLKVENGVIGPNTPPESSINQTIFSKTEPSPNAIEQGRLADCYFLAALQTLAQHNPEKIKSMIQDNGRNNSGQQTYTVTFPGAKDNPVTVSEPSVYETSVFNQARSDLWASIIEKAHRKLTGLQLNDPGGDSADALRLLLGHDAMAIPMMDLASDGDTANLSDFMQKITARNDLFTTETKYDVGSVVDSYGNSVELDPKHQYSLVGFDPVANTVTLQNPHGSNDVVGKFVVEPNNVYVKSKFDAVIAKQKPHKEEKGEIGALLTIKLNDFAKYFDSVAIGQV